MRTVHISHANIAFSSQWKIRATNSKQGHFLLVDAWSTSWWAARCKSGRGNMKKGNHTAGTNCIWRLQICKHWWGHFFFYRCAECKYVWCSAVKNTSAIFHLWNSLQCLLLCDVPGHWADPLNSESTHWHVPLIAPCRLPAFVCDSSWHILDHQGCHQGRHLHQAIESSERSLVERGPLVYPAETQSWCSNQVKTKANLHNWSSDGNCMAKNESPPGNIQVLWSRMQCPALNLASSPCSYQPGLMFWFGVKIYVILPAESGESGC